MRLKYLDMIFEYLYKWIKYLDMRLRYLYKLLVKNSKKSLTKQREKKLMTIGIKQKKRVLKKQKNICERREKSQKN
jgi:hypothetical protein